MSVSGPSDYFLGRVSGRISATKDETGAWVIEPVEVHRVYPLVAVNGAMPVAVPDGAPPDSATDVLIEELRAIIVRMGQEHERHLDDLQRDRDEWREQAKRLALGSPVESKPPMSWWHWLRTTG